MAQKTYNARVKWKRDTSANWTSNDPVLLDGEIIIVDTSSGETRFKVGDGTKRYSQLPFEDEAVRSLISAKVDKVSGKELSSNDYTDAEKSKLAGIAAEANKYTHPAYTSRSSGLYKMTVDATGHVSAVSAVTKADITALGIPGQDTNTTYNAATTSTAGLMSASDKTKLDGIANSANNYVHPTSAGYKHIPSGGVSGQILRWLANGTAKWDDDQKGTAYTCAETLTGGVWIDGKPIYRVCGMQVRAMAASTFTDIELGVAAIENVICADVYLRQGAAWRPANYPNRNTLSVHTWLINNSDTAPSLRIIMGDDMSASAVSYNIEYTKAADAPTYYWLPFLSSPNEEGCVLTASSEYSGGYQMEYAFNGLTNNYWACAISDAQRWVQVQMPYALRNISVKLTSPQGSAVTTANVPVSGAFQGSNDGSSWAALGSYSGRSTAAGGITTHSLNNNTGYKYLRISITSPAASSGDWTGFGDIRIEGEVAT